MKTFRLTFSLAAVALLGGFSSCNKSGDGGGEPAVGGADEVVAGKFVILGTLTDDANKSNAKRNAENALLKYGDGIDGMVGLWAYNAPQCLQALKDQERTGEVKLFSFDEDESTLQGIIDGHIEGTIVQQPYEFGYQSMKYLKMIKDGTEFEIPESKLIDIPAKTIIGTNVEDYWANLRELQALGKAAETAEKPDSDIKFAFVINTPDPFWSYARAGCYKAEQDFGIVADFQTPADGSTSEQNRIMNNLLNKGGYEGVAVTPLDPANQTELLNKVAAAMPLICHDSDAPDSDRRFYLGTNNYDAGRLLGKLVKERMPDGGKLMIFVGKIDMLNAVERRRGLIDELKSEG
ncbi:MAG: substrate-binding domain-containing protein [Verrucomicrobiales bacterium]|nr:substrate-binding domain-containing protein [Verrucomicrobiales bacterium]